MLMNFIKQTDVYMKYFCNYYDQANALVSVFNFPYSTLHLTLR